MQLHRRGTAAHITYSYTIRLAIKFYVPIDPGRQPLGHIPAVKNFVLLWIMNMSEGATMTDLGTCCTDEGVGSPWWLGHKHTHNVMLMSPSVEMTSKRGQAVVNMLSSYYLIPTSRSSSSVCSTWRRHQMETFSELLALCAGYSPVTGEFLAQRLVTRCFLWSALE